MGCPAPCRFCKGRVHASRHRIPQAHMQNITIIDPHQTGFAKGITSKAAPAPLFRRLHQSALYRIAMHVAQLFDSLVLRPNVEIIEARLPDGHRFTRRSLGWMALPAPWYHSLRESLFHTLHRGRRSSHLRLAHEQVEVLRHDHVSQHNDALCRLLREFLETDHAVRRCRARAFFDSNYR